MHSRNKKKSSLKLLAKCEIKQGNLCCVMERSMSVCYTQCTNLRQVPSENAK